MSSGTQETLAVVSDLVARISRVDRSKIRPTSRLVDFGIDSVRAIEIVVDLERIFGVSIPDRDLMEMESLQDIARYLDERKK